MNWRIRSFLAGVALAIVGTVSAATFNLFQPAAGILKGNPSTYVTTAAASSDVISLWTGTCNASSFLRGDGSCAAAGGGGGTVTSITAGTGISASPSSPITSTGTLSVNQAFSPTWTGTHTFSNDITANGVSSADWARLDASNTFLVNVDASGQGNAFINASTGTSALTAVSVANSTNSLRLSLSSTGYSGTILTGGPSGESAAVWTDANVPLSFGTDDTERVRVAGDGSFVNVASDNLDHTGAGGFWRFHQDASNWSVDQCDSFNSTCLSKLVFSVIGNETTLGSGGDTLLNSGSGSVDMTGGNVDVATSGQFRVNLSGAGAKNVCLQDGTNCPAAGGDATLAGNQTFTGINTFSNASNAFTGSGSGLTSLNAGNISSGILAVARGGTGTTTSTGTGSTVLSASPTFTGTVTAATVAATTLTGAGSGVTALDMANAGSGTLAVARGGTGTTTSTGTGSNVLSASPTFTGTITAATINASAGITAALFSGDGSLITSLNVGNVSSGTLAVARGGTGTTTSTGTGSTVLSASPTLTGTTTVATLAATAATVGGSNVCRADGTDCTSNGVTSGSYTGSVTGCTTVPTITVDYTMIGNRVVTVRIPNFSCTSNTTAMTVTGEPVGIRANTTSGWCAVANVENAGALTAPSAAVRMTTSSGLQFALLSTTPYNAVGFNNTSTKGSPGIITCTYDRL